MELIKITDNIHDIPNDLVACIGEFDGIHMAHLKLIDKVKEISRLYNKKSAVITFDPHPDYILGKVKEEKYITIFSDKVRIFDDLNIDYLIIINFDIKISRMDYLDFYDLYLKKFNYLVVGFDFKFGNKGLGTSKILSQIHKNVFIIDEIDFNDCKIGSFIIMNHINEGKIEEANLLLGRPFSITGIVSEGSKIGKTLGFPTANINIDSMYCNLKNGVYCVNIFYNENKFLGIANYGYNPSFNLIKKPRLEVNIFDFEEDIYGKELRIEFIEFIRSEVKFENIDDFLKQINKDRLYCLNKYGRK